MFKQLFTVLKMFSVSVKNVQTRLVQTPEHLAATRLLFEEYAASLSESVCLQNFAEELAALPASYAPPKGRLLLATVDDASAGCVALRLLSDEYAEIKRLYVRPNFRGFGVGKQLMKAVLNEAKNIGYKSMRLDTLPKEMAAAVEMYRAFGFTEIPPYMKNPVAGALCMELDLSRWIPEERVEFFSSRVANAESH
jgi:putative acetyltransferase